MEKPIEEGEISPKDQIRGKPAGRVSNVRMLIKEEEMAMKKGMRKKTREERGKIEEETFLYF